MTTLLVFVPGGASKAARYKPLLARLVKGQPELVVEPFDVPISVFSHVDLKQRADHLLGQITNWVRHYAAKGQPITSIVLVGHSVGGLVAREAYLQDLVGDGEKAGDGRCEWSRLVSRIVLLATPNRGVDPASQRIGTKAAMRLFGWMFTDGFVWKQTLLGSAFVTNLRVRWIRTFNAPDFPGPYVMQLRVPNDSMARRNDSRDVSQFPHGGERLLTGSTHANLASLDGTSEDIEERLEILHQAFFGEPIVNNPEALSAHTSVALLIHGIRSSADGWPAKVGAALRAADPGMLAHAPTYGYLAAFDFAIPPLRRSRRRWIRDIYSDLVARHPNATFHFVGHSNGTYLFSKLIETVPGARFESAYLGGCVLRRDYSWGQDKLGDTPEASVRRVLNIRASSDRPVGWLCSALRSLGSREIGTAGLDGFNQAPGPTQPYVLIGDHGAAFDTPGALDRITAWVSQNNIVHPVADQTTPGPSKAFSRVSRMLGQLPLGVSAALLTVAAVLGTPWLFALAVPVGIIYILKVM